MEILKSRLIRYIVFFMPLILAVIFVLLFISENKKLNQLEINYQKIVREYEKKTAHNDSLKNLLVKYQTQNNYIDLSDWDIDKMKKKGLSDPVNDIIADLTNHSDLIPYQGTLGGTMRFYDRQITILNQKWVYAYFEDGHYGGYLLLEYNVTNNRIINWKKIAAMLD